MPHKELNPIALVQSYLNEFRLRQNANTKDGFAPKAILVLTEFLVELNNRNPKLNHVVYPNLGYHVGFFNILTGFDPIEMSNNDLPSYVLMEKFISDIKDFNLNTSMSRLFNKFQVDVLSPAFSKFKREMSLNYKETFAAIFESLNLLIEEPVTKNIEKTGNELRIEASKGLSWNLVNTVASKGTIYVPIVYFMGEMERISKEPTLYTRDVIKLKEPALLVQNTLLAMPEIKEMDRFFWLINLICDFINNHIYKVFESDKVKGINNFFSQLDVTITKAEEIEKKPLEEISEELSRVYA